MARLLHRQRRQCHAISERSVQDALGDDDEDGYEDGYEDEDEDEVKIHLTSKLREECEERDLG